MSPITAATPNLFAGPKPFIPDDPSVTAAKQVPVAPSPVPADAAPLADSTWKIHTTDAAVSSIIDAIKGAETVVNAEFFGVSDAGTGALLTEALVDRAKSGVEVNVIADQTSEIALPVGSFQRFKSKIRDAGGNVIVNTRVPMSSRVKEYPALRHVDHRKAVTIDGNRAFLGGMNFIKMSDGYHDAMVELSGIDAAKAGAEQLDRWSRVGGTSSPAHQQAIDDAFAKAQEEGQISQVKVQANAPEQQRFELSETYRSSIQNAKDRLLITSPGFSDRPVIQDIKDAITRGVDVTIVGPGEAPLGIGIINNGNRTHYRELLKLGAKVYEIPEVLHMKALIADDQATISSYNITGRSRLHDHEVGVTSTSPSFVKALEDIIQTDVKRGTAVDPASITGVGQSLADFFINTLNFSY